MSDQESQNRKSDHIDLTFESQEAMSDDRFYYEPMLNPHPSESTPSLEVSFGEQILNAPIWISSMTGGTDNAGEINKRLARACKTYGLGMGLGSCRSLLNSDDHFSDFDLRDHIGDQPLFANLGIAQVEELVRQNEVSKINELIHRLRADGLIIHINPLQEWLQPEGDRIRTAPIDIIKTLLENFKGKLIVKEVGQGFGPESLKALLQLKLFGVEFGAHGGTNFAKLEMLRADDAVRDTFESIAKIGHSAEEMCHFFNKASELIDNTETIALVSGGIKNFLDGYYCTELIKNKAIFAQASSFLKHAMAGEDNLNRYIEFQIKGLRLAKNLLKIRKR